MKMKKKIKILLSIILTIVMISLVFFLIDFSRISKQEKPLFCIKNPTGIIKDGGTIEYIGLGYKVIDFNRVGGFDEMKIGTWFMQYDDFKEEYETYENKHQNVIPSYQGNRDMLNEITEIPSQGEEPNSSRTLEKVEMKIKEGTLTKTGATIIITDTNQSPYAYGEAYRIDKKENGEWKPCKPIIDTYGFPDIAILIGKDGKLEMKEDWSKLYGTLEKGQYRFVKSQYENDAYQDFWVEFTIEL